MVVMAVLAAAICCVGRTPCSSTPMMQPAKNDATDQHRPPDENHHNPMGSRGRPFVSAPEGLRKLPVRVNSRAARIGSCLGAEQLKGLLGIGQGFPRPEPGGRR